LTARCHDPRRRDGSPGLTHRVAVHVWSDHGFGPSTPRVRLYVDSLLAYEGLGPALSNLGLWEVANVAWPSGAVTPVATDDGSPKVIPNDAAPLFNPWGARSMGLALRAGEVLEVELVLQATHRPLVGDEVVEPEQPDVEALRVAGLGVVHHRVRADDEETRATGG
jgi:hypothetical protein